MLQKRISFLLLTLASFLICVRFAVSGVSKDSLTFRDFLVVLDRIESKAYYPAPDDKTKQRYIQFVKEKIASSPARRDEIIRQIIERIIFEMGDPYAAFLTPQDVALEETRRQGQDYPGYGLMLATRSGRVIVAGPLPNSPAERAGILPNDVLESIDGKPVHALFEVLHSIDARTNRPILIEVGRLGRRMSVKITPGPIRMTPFISRDFPHAGYIAMEVMIPGNEIKFFKTVSQFQKQGKRFLILDLRNCVGGDVDTAARIAGYLLKSQDIVYVEKTREKRTAFTNPVPVHLEIPVVVLTNSATASAAELLAGALKDHRRATLIGERTVGKGTMQGTWPLRDGSALRITIGTYLTPLGNTVADLGIAPDVVHPWKKGESIDALEELMRK